MDLVAIYKAASFVENSSEASITIADEELRDIIADVAEDPDYFGITVESGNIELGENLILHVIPPKLRLGQFHFTFDDYLRNSKNRIKEPSNYYIVSINYHNKDVDTPTLISKYRSVLSLVTLFKECSAYLDESSVELVFVDSNVLKIPVNFTSEDLALINESVIKKIIANFAEDTHKDQKLTILASGIKSLCESKTKDSSFSFMLRNLKLLLESFHKGYKVFVSGFSYEKILDQLRVAKIEEMGKIHKVFSDIQNQILGIPVATIIVATQMKQAHDWDAQALINTIIVLGALFFTAMILFVLFNQWQTLNAISDELQYKKDQAENNYKAIYTDIQATFVSLSRRLRMQKWVFRILCAFVLAGLYLTFKFYFYLTPYAWSYLHFW
ncbi:hypothetical protein [Citrobacter freundii]|uniref:hypothetical protein n=1 Tax=Citrobacter freundii TaxID=546 RepID=UPI000BD08B34|nr:hypothetical protein [Citrobacter freundii]MBJ9307224.1 hypothetical protein [Citrobacter freundii]MDT7376078.1 hypothetical protein [Citrobacter freundii]PCQ40160.1 hypothetical protein CQA28_24720 [Citrobacter freundii]